VQPAWRGAQAIDEERSECRLDDAERDSLRPRRAPRPIKARWQDDIADAALFLASDRPAWISGVVLDVAGGSVLACTSRRPPYLG
jgi:NAD(P)-dependent dehydrogenase (short-subunit alcohol dehydrogenase family)